MRSADRIVDAHARSAESPRAAKTSNAASPCPACTDFYLFADSPDVTRRLSGALAQLGTPADSRRLEKQITEIVRDVGAAARMGRARAGSDEFRLGSYYEACLDTAKVEALGAQVLEPEFRRLARATTTDEVMRLLGEWQRSYDIGFVTAGVVPDSRDARANMPVLIFAGGLGLPSVEFYVRTDDRYPAIRTGYEAYARTLFALAGDPADSRPSTRALCSTWRPSSRVGRRRRPLRAIRGCWPIAWKCRS